ncbi:dehydrodolichyl diphosphate synthase complex subunit Nus1 [Ostrinia furnacalis]|uniref:dehydrodolichyl diphosphate synthase complex subunit Nus1 n=1 Tax=Ostrinia furnacalis TaxID=93504 RepID=UPI0010396B07|nr:dehydrodolichyl diphosphate synthase complex subunit Nus1 [Ostrinia furnacalis]
MLSRLLRQFLFTLTHWVVNVLVAVQNVYCRFWTKKGDFPSDQGTEKDIKVILKHLPDIKKKPKHLVVLADTSEHSLQSLALVVIWSLVAGVPYVSFHDITGELKSNEEKLFLEVEKCKKGIPGCIKWSKLPNLNGYTNGTQAHTVTVNIFTSSDGRPKIAQCISDIANNKVICRRESEEYTAQELGEALAVMYPPAIPDPELILYSGSLCSSHGFLPWQVRLTEFVQVSIDHCINVNSYLGALYKYNKCDQRFGK